MIRADITKTNQEILLQIHHRIRNPMNAVLGFTQILNEDKLLTESERQAYYDIINKKTVELINIMEDLIEITLNKLEY